MKIESHQAQAYAEKHSAFSTAKVVLVDVNGNIKFDPTPEARKNFIQGKKSEEVYIVKDTQENGTTDSKDNSGKGK